MGLRKVKHRLPVFQFVNSIDPVEDTFCWEWTGRLDKDGYGVIYVKGTPKRAHRWSYQTYVGPIPENHDLDHLCRNRKCVNPEHLEAVDHATNVDRIPKATHCPQGHPYDETNTYHYNGWRYCRACRASRGH